MLFSKTERETMKHKMDQIMRIQAGCVQYHRPGILQSVIQPQKMKYQLRPGVKTPLRFIPAGKTLVGTQAWRAEVMRPGIAQAPMATKAAQHMAQKAEAEVKAAEAEVSTAEAQQKLAKGDTHGAVAKMAEAEKKVKEAKSTAPAPNAKVAKAEAKVEQAKRQLNGWR